MQCIGGGDEPDLSLAENTFFSHHRFTSQLARRRGRPVLLETARKVYILRGMKRLRISLVLLCFIVAGTFCWSLCRRGSVSGDIGHEAYVWQRSWDENLKESLHEHASEFSRIVVLGAEISLKGGQREVALTEVDYELLKGLETEVGLALRIGPYAGPFRRDDDVFHTIGGVARKLCADAKDAGLMVSELQVDFDCATSKLAGYRIWVQELRKKLTVPVTITALPSWMSSPRFKQLVRSTDGYVLQVHSLERVQDPNARITLCDPEAALTAVKRAGRLGVKFRVALPTYGYYVVVNKAGEIVRVTKSRSALSGRSGAVRELRSDATAMAGVLAKMTESRPRCMDNVIWYRFPTDDEQMNWSWVTLESIMLGTSPRGQLAVRAVEVTPQLWDLWVRNIGDADASLNVRVEMGISTGSVRMAEAMSGFRMHSLGMQVADIRYSDGRYPVMLKPSEEQIVCWVRLSEDAEVTSNVLPME